MPPKPTGKKGDVEDFSDASTLPQANIFKFTIVHKQFFAQEQRDKVKTAIKDKLLPSAAGKILTLSREDIINYGKSKQIILDSAQLNALPGDDSRKGLSELDMVARSAADRLFELSVQIRRLKQTRLANTSQDEVEANDTVDGFIFMPDYPTTRPEILAFSKYSQALNAVFEIEEIAPQAGDDDEEDAKESQKQSTPDSEDARKSALASLEAFRSARSDCDFRSGLRQLAIFKFPFVNQQVTYQVTEADGSLSLKHRSAEDNLVIELIQKGIDKFAQYFVQYGKFKKLVSLKPLVPDRASLNQIEELKREQKKKNAWLQDATLEHEAAIKELESSKVSEDDKDELMKIDKEITDLNQKFTQAKEQTEARFTQITAEMQDLVRKSKRSLDDEDKAVFSMKHYSNDFVANSETSNNISSMLSAMITHIDAQSKPEENVKSEASTAGDTNIDELFESFAFDIACDLGLKDKGPDPIEPSFHDTISSFNLNPAIKIEEETNKSLNVRQNVPAAVLEVEENRLEQIAKREQLIFQNLKVPGKKRDCMPKVPHQSERLRSAENPAFYPFCTLPVDEAERLLQLRAFQQMIKANYIDQGQKGLQKHTKYQIFERCFENHMDMNIFSQCFADALLDDPEVTSMYYPRTDSLLIAMFNKVKQSSTKPSKDSKFKHVSAEINFDTKDADGEKMWRAAYRVMPDFENWLAVFAEEIIQEQEIIKPVKQESVVPETAAPAKPNPKDKANVADAVDPNVLPITLMKYVLDEEALPKSLVNVEDAKIQVISEKSAFMYPDDNSIMRVDHFQIGGKLYSKSVVIKDNLRFGLRQKQQVPSESKEYGLVRQVLVGDTEFYLHFENGTKMGVEQCQMRRNPQKLIKVLPPPPTQQEIDFKLDQIKKYQEAAQKAQKANKPLVTDIEIPKTPQPTWEPQALNYLDTLYSDKDFEHSHALTTLTFKNGLIVQVLGNGHILQTHERNLGVSEDHDEIDRLCTKEGIVIRQFKNLDVEMLFPDGVHAAFSRSKLEWIVTNNKGMQRHFKDGVYTDLQSIPCAVETDAVTGAKMLIREDEIISVTYKDGSRYCQHRDGTKFHTSADGKEIRVEKRNFASHCVKIDVIEPKKSMAGPYARALDGRVLETYLPDGSRAQTFLDQMNTKNDQKTVYRTIISRSDLSVIFADSLGHISVCSSNTRDALNDMGCKQRIGFADVDYLTELDRSHGQFTAQVYQVHVNSKAGKSHIKTKNCFDDTVFTLNHDMTLVKSIDGKPVTQQNSATKPIQKDKKAAKQQKIAEQKEAEVVMDIEVEETGQFVEPTLRSFVYPRFFIVDSQGKTKELLSRLQLSYEMRQKGLQPQQSIKQKMAEVFNNQFVENTYFLTKVINMEQIQQQQQTLNSIELPENAKDVLKGKIDVPDILLLVPRQQQYLFNQIFKMPDCDSFNQQAFANDYQRYVQWRLENVRYETEFGLIYAPTTKDAKIDWEKIEDEQFFNKRIAIKILKNRAQPRQKFDASEFKAGAMRDMVQSQSIKEFTSSHLHSLGATMNSITSQKVNPKNQLEVYKKPEASKQLKRSQLQQDRVNKKLETLNQMKVAHDFIPEYFETQEGQLFTSENPSKPLSQEAIIRMQQRLERMQRSQLQQNDQEFDAQPAQQNNEVDEARDNPIVALEPDELKQGSHFTGSRKDRSMIGGEKLSSVEIAQLPSLYKQEKMYLNDKEQEQLLKAEEHHIVKTKDFNVYGRLREEKPFVKAIVKSSAQNELNEKFITTECITDRRVKISSQAPRFYMNAPSVEDVRKQGQHQMILSAIEKKQTFGELINQANSMVTGVLHDSLKRSLQVMPGAIVFGHIRPGTINDIAMSVKNEDSVPHRITIKGMIDPRIVVRQEEYGIIAPGMTKQITVTIRLNEDVDNCTIQDTIQIVSKHDIFKVPVTATVVQADEFADLNQKQMTQTGKSIQNSRVREKLMNKIQESKQSQGPVVLTQMPQKLNEAGSEFGDL